MLTTSGAFFVAIFQKPLGLPEWAMGAGAVVGLLCAVSIRRLQVRARRRAKNSGLIDPAAAKCRTRLMLIPDVIAS